MNNLPNPGTISSHIYNGLDILSLKNDRPHIFSNTWLSFIQFLIIRNRGYGLRKIFNLIAEIFELGCLAYIMDITLIQSFILLPITHMIVGYLQEYHTILYRATFNKKSNLVFTFGVFLVLASMAYYLIDENKSFNNALIIIFVMRSFVILTQTFFTCKNIILLATRRVRPHIKFQWISLVVTIILAVGTLQFQMNSFVNILLVGLIFNTMRFLQEYIYFKIVQSEIHKLRFLKSTYERPLQSLRSAWHETSMVFFHLLMIVCFSMKYYYFTFTKWPIIVFFIISFYDRILSRPFRSLNLEITKILEKKYFSMSHKLSRRLLLITAVFVFALVFFILFAKKWPVNHIFATISILAVCILNNAILTSRKVVLWSNSKKTNVFIFLQLIVILVLINHSWPQYVFYMISVITTLFGIYLLTFNIQTLHIEQKIQNNSLIKLPKNILCFEVYINNYSNHWKNLILNIRLLNDHKNLIYFLNFNQRIKYFFTNNEKKLFTLLNQYPLNVQSIKKVSTIPALSELTKVNNTEFTKMNFFGFWTKFRKYNFTKTELDRIHYFNRRWINRNIYIGGSKELKLEKYTVYIADQKGNQLWILKN